MNLKLVIIRALLIVAPVFPFSGAYSQTSNKVDSASLARLKISLNKVYRDDQNIRSKWDTVMTKYSDTSTEYKEFINQVATVDSSNLIVVTNILDKYGWLGAKIVGKKGNTAIFLAVQHSNIKLQQKYLPIMRDAYVKKNVKGEHLAMMEDRIKTSLGKKQIYGTQLSEVGGKYTLFPIKDEKNVDKRRREVGLMPLAEYLKQFNIKYP